MFVLIESSTGHYLTFHSTNFFVTPLCKVESSQLLTKYVVVEKIMKMWRASDFAYRFYRNSNVRERERERERERD